MELKWNGKTLVLRSEGKPLLESADAASSLNSSNRYYGVALIFSHRQFFLPCSLSRAPSRDVVGLGGNKLSLGVGVFNGLVVEWYSNTNKNRYAHTSQVLRCHQLYNTNNYSSYSQASFSFIWNDSEKEFQSLAALPHLWSQNQAEEGVAVAPPPPNNIIPSFWLVLPWFSLLCTEFIKYLSSSCMFVLFREVVGWNILVAHNREPSQPKSITSTPSNASQNTTEGLHPFK